MSTPREQVAAVRAAAKIIVESVKEMGPDGAPSGPMYAALMGKMSLSQYTSIMDALVKARFLRFENHVYYFVKDMP